PLEAGRGRGLNICGHDADKFGQTFPAHFRDPVASHWIVRFLIPVVRIELTTYSLLRTGTRISQSACPTPQHASERMSRKRARVRLGPSATEKSGASVGVH